jgi:serine protease AprX
MRASPDRGNWGRRILAAVAVVLLTLVLLPSVTAQGSVGAAKLSAEVEQKLRLAGNDDLIPVIIQTAGEPSSAHFARLHGRGGLIKTRYAALSGYSGHVPAAQLAPLADDPEILRVSYDSEVKAHLDVARKAVNTEAALLSFGSLDGSGIGVAVVDTGVKKHDDLDLDRLVRVQVVADDGGYTIDQYGHGTHVAGIVAGNGTASSDLLSFRTFKGIAPRARIVSIRALRGDGTGRTSDIISAIDWAIANKATYNIRVMNLSLGHPVFESYRTDPLCVAVRSAYAAGIVVVTSAGNDGGVGSGFGTITSPGNDPTAITVGAMDDRNTVDRSDDVLAWYSSKGPTLIDYVVKPDLVAPGTRIVSLRAPSSYLDTNYHQFTLKIKDYRLDPVYGENDGAYYTLSGTSMAAPMVAGAAALMLQQEPGLSADTVKARLMVSATKDSNLVFETGAGYLDVDAALKAQGYASTSLSPTAVLASDGSIYVGDTSLIWGGESLIWGGESESIIWGGESLIWGGEWDLTLIWGESKGEAYGIVLTDVPESTTTTEGYIWGGDEIVGKAGDDTTVQNTEITSSSLIWSGEGSLLNSTTGTVEIMGAVWGGGGGGGCKRDC